MAFSIPRELLSELYTKKELSTYRIADMLGCCPATVWKRLIQYRICVRPPGTVRVRVTKRQLERLYLREKLSTWKIEKRLAIPRGTIHRKLVEFAIPARDRSDSHIVYPKKDFSGSLVEKAYLIGFRIGDLGVRKFYPGSKVICVATGSTIPAQITLVKKLFENYGHVWIKETANKKINVQVFLNPSFTFLLSKELPHWVEGDKAAFFSFLAGFSDAEGSIYLNRNNARYALGNYDSALLYKIQINLQKFGIACNAPTEDRRKGQLNSQGYPYRLNYWTLRVSAKADLFRLLQELKPYVKHEHKVLALSRGIANILQRNKLFNNNGA